MIVMEQKFSTLKITANCMLAFFCSVAFLWCLAPVRILPHFFPWAHHSSILPGERQETCLTRMQPALLNLLHLTPGATRLKISGRCSVATSTQMQGGQYYMQFQNSICIAWQYHLFWFHLFCP